MTAGADILVRGAGPVGCTLALALRASRHAVRLVDPQPAARAAFRPIALSHASRLILERAGGPSSACRSTRARKAESSSAYCVT